jgi:hypothetical protein
MSAEYLASPFFKSSFPRVNPMRVWVYSRDPFSYPACLVDSTFQRTEPFWMPGRISQA